MNPEFFLDLWKIESHFGRVKICIDKPTDLRQIFLQKYGLDQHLISLSVISSWAEVGFNELIKPWNNPFEDEKHSAKSYKTLSERSDSEDDMKFSNKVTFPDLIKKLKSLMKDFDLTIMFQNFSS